MTPTTQAYLLALTANIIFAFAIQVFAHYSEKISAVWMNWFKAVVAFVCFIAATLIIGGSFDYPLKITGLLFISGILGLAIGDLCLLAALKDLGPGRTMVLVAFHPLITGVLSFLVHGETMEFYKITAVFFMIACMLTFSLENFKNKGEWNFKGILLVLIAVTMDSSSMIMIKEVNEESNIHNFEGNLIRAFGAIIFMFFWSIFSLIKSKNSGGERLKLFKPFMECSSRGKVLILLASLGGTFIGLALLFEANALTQDNLAGLASINVTCSIFAMIFESIHKKIRPSKYFYIAFLFMITGLTILIFGNRIF